MTRATRGVVLMAVLAAALAITGAMAYAALRASAAEAALQAGDPGAAGRILAGLPVDLLLLAVAVTGLLGLLATAIHGMVMGTVARITARMRAIGEGNLGERIPPEGPRELRDLAAAVNGMAQALSLQEQRLRTAERLSAMGCVLAGVAHEVNNPLTYMVMNDELVRRTAEEWAARPDLSEADRAKARDLARRAERNLEGFQRLADLTAAIRGLGRARSSIGRTDVNALVAGCVLVAQPTPAQACVVEQDLVARHEVMADHGALSRVVLNLLLNAFDAVGHHGRVAVRSADEQGGAWVRIEVEDDGPGVPESFLPRLFQAFATTKPQGTGLGLALSREVVQAHEGTLTHEAVPGGGARFVVRLPAASRSSAGATDGAPPVAVPLGTAGHATSRVSPPGSPREQDVPQPPRAPPAAPP